MEVGFQLKSLLKPTFTLTEEHESSSRPDRICSTFRQHTGDLVRSGSCEIPQQLKPLLLISAYHPRVWQGSAQLVAWVSLWASELCKLTAVGHCVRAPSPRSAWRTDGIGEEWLIALTALWNCSAGWIADSVVTPAKTESKMPRCRVFIAAAHLSLDRWKMQNRVCGFSIWSKRWGLIKLSVCL